MGVDPVFSFLAELFGKSREVRELDRLLRERGVNPHAVNDATKFTICKWIREILLGEEAAVEPEARSRLRANLQASSADLLAFCALGEEDFAKANSVELANAQEARVAAATEGANDFDAGIVMLALHAGVAHPEIVEAVEIESD